MSKYIFDHAAVSEQLGIKSKPFSRAWREQLKAAGVTGFKSGAFVVGKGADTARPTKSNESNRRGRAQDSLERETPARSDASRSWDILDAHSS